ncbi:MAG: recombinase family protein [Candidatus Peregrinibacteria bacterium]|nr:recombinase family protein [Candidatus Peregrinibacteria bacterium]
MTCKKCGYSEKKEVKLFGSNLCRICATFAPDKIQDFQNYVSEKIDWKTLDTFRKYKHHPGAKQKKGMEKMATIGRLQTRPPLGYDVVNGNLNPNEDAVRVHSLFKTFLNRNYSLNSMSKNFSLSVNGLKKVLTNRTYLGEIKFNGRIHKGDHQAIISPEIFYAVQRKLKTYLRPRKL